MSAMRGSSRRVFLKQWFTGAAVLRAGGAMGLLAAAQQAAPAKSKVVIARDNLLRGTGSTVDSRRMLALLDRAMQTPLRPRPCDRGMEQAGSPRRQGGSEGECAGWARALQQSATGRGHLRAAAGGGNQSRRYCGLGPRQRRDGTLRLSSVDGRKRRSMLRHRSRRLRTGSGCVWQRWQPVVQNPHPTMQCPDQCPGAERPRRRGRDHRDEEHVRRHSQPQQVPPQRLQSVHRGPEHAARDPQPGCD